uniref:RNase H type-1 domain-containing protein n=1 Tax=Fagus sylvatica TaxID=28930 RepID=A0A2N9EXN1_FAGSY
MGVLIRDHGGQAMGAMCGPVMSLPSGVHPKIGACIQALSFALDMGFTAMVFEGPLVPFLHNLFARPVATTIEDMWLEEVQWSFYCVFGFKNIQFGYQGVSSHGVFQYLFQSVGRGGPC